MVYIIAENLNRYVYYNFITGTGIQFESALI
jgi:hypothetical protein